MAEKQQPLVWSPYYFGVAFLLGGKLASNDTPPDGTGGTPAAARPTNFNYYYHKQRIAA